MYKKSIDSDGNVPYDKIYGDALSEYIDNYNNAPNTLPMSIRKMLYNMYGKLSDSDKLLFEIGEKELNWDNL